MAGPPAKWDDTRVEEIMGKLLQAGVLLAAAVVLVSGIFYLIRYGNTLPHYRIFRGEPQDLRSVPGIVRFALGGHSRGLLQVGLLLLLATPIARVVFSVYAFIREKDRLYIGVTLLVLAVLIYSLVWGRA
ncbi:MAG TPA: DUF1634 domain-containing protein [Chthonomonadaceae bacterium]|nr:DUF1634 domain-containing protein [Chthonomonadaceae bacterium]